MAKTGKRILATSEEIDRISDFLLAFAQQKDNRICPICKRDVSEWGSDWLPTPFEACAKCWDVYRGY